MYKKISLIIFYIALLFSNSVRSQNDDFSLEHTDTNQIATKKPSFKQWSKSGDFEFHWRTFFMSTVNEGDLLDYAALATGAGLGYQSPTYKGFRVAFSGFFVFNLFEHNVGLEDPTTQNYNRYEITLFDMNDFDNKRDLDRLEELYVAYHYKKIRLTLGRQKFNSPLLNEQDNRMRPNIFSGITGRYLWRNFTFDAAAFHAMTIRGTVDWFSVQNSFGVYPFGRNPFGESSDYKGNIKSKGIAVLGIKHKTKGFQTQVWQYFAENVFATTFSQSEWLKSHKNFGFKFGVQGFWQQAVNYGGNENQHLTYNLQNEKTWGLGAKIEVTHKKHSFSLNNLHISSSGRFLFPREWGREQFFASLPRERFEGNGAVNAYTLKYQCKIPKRHLILNAGLSAVQLQDIQNPLLNKYGMPSYYHFSLGADYSLSGYFEGLHLRFLIINKLAQNRANVPDNYRINRVDLWHFNFVIDYLF